MTKLCCDFINHWFFGLGRAESCCFEQEKKEKIHFLVDQSPSSLNLYTFTLTSRVLIEIATRSFFYETQKTTQMASHQQSLTLPTSLVQCSSALERRDSSLATHCSESKSSLITVSTTGGLSLSAKHLRNSPNFCHIALDYTFIPFGDLGKAIFYSSLRYVQYF